ncbi:MAG: hypothetical protein WCJ64_00235 [Rhodospirillaceae bacterium]
MRWVLPPGASDLIASLRSELSRRTLPARDRAALADLPKLKGRHGGERCFILGGGSSIKKQDLSKLSGEIVISVSNTFVHPLFHDFRPRYHVLPPLVSSHGQYFSGKQFVTWLSDMERATDDAEMVFHIGDRRLIEDNGLFRNRTIHWVEYCPWFGDMATRLDLSRVPNIWSVSEVAVCFAVHLGFERIYLLGFDHDWFNGPLVYFFDHTKEHAMEPHKNDLNDVDAEFQMRRHAEIFRKYKWLFSMRRNIYNANAEKSHYMDVFPKADFDSLFTSL